MIVSHPEIYGFFIVHAKYNNRMLMKMINHMVFVGAATPPSSVIQTFTPNTTKRAQLPEVKVFNIDCDTNQKLDAGL
jgi:hypothetical protein